MPLPILSVAGANAEVWEPTTFRALGKSEADLERLIGAAPVLLGLEDLRTNVAGPYAAFHQVAVETPLGREIIPDIVFLTQSGHVIVVEVKLADNPALNGRDVVAQVIDYAASLATHDDDELAQLFDSTLAAGARFSDLVRKRFPACRDPVGLANELVRKIRAAELHLVVACDGAPEGLREFVEAVTAQRALGNYELRVCELVPYVAGAGTGDRLFVVATGVTRTEVVARTLVQISTSTEGVVEVAASVTPLDELEHNLAATRGTPAAPQPQIAAAVAAYSRMTVPGTSLSGDVTHPDYRKIYVPGWPSTLHYEFLHRKTKDEFGAELHFESLDPRVQRAARAVRDAAAAGAAELPSSFGALAWDPEWLKNKGRIRLVFTSDTDPEVVASALVALIRWSRPIVDKALAG